MRMRLPVVGALLSVVTVACGGGETSDSTSDAGTTQDQVEPKFSSIQQKIFLNSCATAACHSPSGKQGKLDLTQANAYVQLLGADGKGAPIPDTTDPGPQQGIADGYVLVSPGNPEKSFLLKKLDPHLDSKYGAVMPFIYGYTLSEQEIQAVSDWIKNGAHND